MDREELDNETDRSGENQGAFGVSLVSRFSPILRLKKES
jgi:hypothetical protein